MSGTSRNPAEVEGLRRLAELTGGVNRTRLAKFRILDIVCAKDHRLGQVLITPDGPIIIGTTILIGQEGERYTEAEFTDGIPTTNTLDVDEGFTARSRQMYAVPLDDQEAEHVGDFSYPFVSFQCRCRRETIARSWIREQVDSGRKRVTLKDNANT